MQLPKCDKCGKDVRLDEGLLSINIQEVREVKSAREAWKEEHSKPILSGGELLTYPESAQWKWGHCKCDHSSSYWIEADRIDTAEKALHWTLHLMEKNWFEFTDWSGVIKRFYPECS